MPAVTIPTPSTELFAYPKYWAECYGVTAGNMDSMINRYTADRKLRSDDAYTAGGRGGWSFTRA